MLPAHGGRPMAVWEKERGRLCKEDWGRILATDGLPVFVSGGTNANNGSQIHFGISSSMRVVGQRYSFKWLCPSYLPCSLEFYSLWSFSPCIICPSTLCHLDHLLYHACCPVHSASLLYYSLSLTSILLICLQRLKSEMAAKSLLADFCLAFMKFTWGLNFSTLCSFVKWNRLAANGAGGGQ